MLKPTHYCCTNSKLERRKTVLTIDDLRFDVVIVYCKSCGVVRPSGSTIFDGSKTNEVEV